MLNNNQTYSKIYLLTEKHLYIMKEGTVYITHTFLFQILYTVF